MADEEIKSIEELRVHPVVQPPNTPCTPTAQRLRRWVPVLCKNSIALRWLS